MYLKMYMQPKTQMLEFLFSKENDGDRNLSVTGHPPADDN